MITAYYMPIEAKHSADFPTEEEAKEYIKSRKDLDSYAWLILPTEKFQICESVEDMCACTGSYPYLPAHLRDNPVSVEKYKKHRIEYEQRCKKLEITPEPDNFS